MAGRAAVEGAIGGGGPAVELGLQLKVHALGQVKEVVVDDLAQLAPRGARKGQGRRRRLLLQLVTAHRSNPVFYCPGIPKLFPSSGKSDRNSTRRTLPVWQLLP